MKTALERLASEQETTVSALIIEQIHELLGHRSEIREDAPYTLTTAERYLLMRMDTVMAKIEPEYRDSYMKNVEAFQEGYTAEYSRIFSQMYKELSRKNCELVWDILDMLRMLGVSYERLDEHDKQYVDEESCHYRGFDHNDELEGSMASYVEYLAITKRWEETISDSRQYSDNGNSHCPMLPTYERMLSAYQKVRNQRRLKNPHGSSEWTPLSREEIQSIIR